MKSISTSYSALYFIAILSLCVPHKALANTIMVLGDSISAAYGMNPEKGWVNLLQQRLKEKGYSNYQIINASISGNTTRDGLGRLAPLLTKHQPSIIIIELGGNDGLRGYPVKLMKNNLQSIIDLSRNNGAKILLAGIEIPPNYGPRYAQLFRQSFITIAQNNKDIAFLPFILKDIALKPDLMQKDGIHPKEIAQPILLDNIWPFIKPIID